MNNFVRNLVTEWRKLKLPFQEATFVVAVSGGADSVSLLAALYELRKLKKLNLRFVVAHFNHDLRGEESERDAEFVKKLTQEFGFELALGKGDIEKQGNLEQNARRARYAFLRQIAENLHARGILTAHTQNDQAETLLINLIRGSGIEGLSGMKAIRSPAESRVESNESATKSEIQNPKSEILLVRPLLNWAKRADTENYCHLQNIEYRYDTMNEDLAFRRVRVRKVLLPLLEDFNPKIVETLAQTAFLLQKDFAELQARDAIREEISAELSLKEVKKIPSSARQRLLRDWLKMQRGDLRNLESKHFEAIEKLMFSTKSGKIAELPGRESVVKENGKLTFRAKSDEIDSYKKTDDLSE